VFGGFPYAVFKLIHIGYFYPLPRLLLISIGSYHLQIETIYSFHIWISFISFLIALVRNYNIILNNSWETGHPCLIPDIKKTISVFSQLVWCWLEVCHI
jgi:predicted ferric reductase